MQVTVTIRICSCQDLFDGDDASVGHFGLVKLRDALLGGFGVGHRYESVADVLAGARREDLCSNHLAHLQAQNLQNERFLFRKSKFSILRCAFL